MELQVLFTTVRKTKQQRIYLYIVSPNFEHTLPLNYLNSKKRLIRLFKN